MYGLGQADRALYNLGQADYDVFQVLYLVRRFDTGDLRSFFVAVPEHMS